MSYKHIERYLNSLKRSVIKTTEAPFINHQIGNSKA